MRKYVNTYRKVKTSANGKTHSKAPKIQRLVTPQTLQRKRRLAAIKRNRIIKVGAAGPFLVVPFWLLGPDMQPVVQIESVELVFGSCESSAAGPADDEVSKQGCFSENIRSARSRAFALARA